MAPVTDHPPTDGQPLREQRGGFDYGYRMKCSNGHFTVVLPARFQSQQGVDGGAVACEVCSIDVPVVNENIAVRDPDDPALDQHRIAKLVWYHTSTYADWPVAGYAEMVAERFRGSEVPMPPSVFADMLHREQTKALHLGTYESAIENMHRRMRNEDDAHSQFYLHRVSLKPIDVELIDTLIRHESHDEASQLTIDDLAGLQVVRYLNVEESPGSVSLAINPVVIATVQSAPIPLPTITLPVTQHAADSAAQLERRIEAINADLSPLPKLSPLQLLLARKSDDGIGMQIHALQRSKGEATRQFVRTLESEYLQGINPIVQKHFTYAIGRPSTGAVADFHDKFRAHAALLQRRDVVAAALRDLTPRTPQAR